MARNSYFVPALKKNISHFSENLEGYYGQYINLKNGQGIKIIRVEPSGCEQIVIKTKEKLLKSRTWKKAVRELSALKMLEGSKLTPKGYKVVAVRCLKGFWYPGIIMDHIEGKGFSSAKRCIIDGKTIIIDEDTLETDDLGVPKNISKLINQKFKPFGVKHLDLHEGNLLVEKGKLKVIDLGRCKISKKAA